MKRVLLLVGSPRKTGNVRALADELARGAREAGAAVEILDLHDLDIKPCQGCFHCRRADHCAIQDDGMQHIYEALRAADAVVIAAPVYFRHINARTQLLLERLFPMMGPDFQPRFGRRKAALLYAQGNQDGRAYLQTFTEIENSLRALGLDPIATLVFAGANVPGRSAAGDGEMLAKAYETGRQLAG